MRRDPPADLSRGGIVIPESAKWRGERATVLAVGPGKKNSDGSRKPMSVVPGDYVLLPEYAGVEHRVNGELLALITEDEIIAVLPHDARA